MEQPLLSPFISNRSTLVFMKKLNCQPDDQYRFNVSEKNFCLETNHSKYNQNNKPTHIIIF